MQKSPGGSPYSKQVFDYQFNFVIVGESGVGKSCIVLNFAEQKPRRQHQVTIACEFASRIIQAKGKDVKIQIWDTAGQENFRSITRSYYRSSVAAIAVYDITNRKTFEKVQSWIQELKENAHSNICLYLVGNKMDLERNREVKYEEGYNLAKQLRVKFTETCAFELNTIEPMFKTLAEDVLNKIDMREIDPKNEHFGVKIGTKKPIGGGATSAPSSSSSNKLGSKDYKERSSSKSGKKKCCG